MPGEGRRLPFVYRPSHDESWVHADDQVEVVILSRDLGMEPVMSQHQTSSGLRPLVRTDSLHEISQATVHLVVIFIHHTGAQEDAEAR